MKTMVDTRHASLYAHYPESGTALLWIADRYGKPHLWHETMVDPCISVLDVASLAYKNHLTHVWVNPSYGDFPVEESHDDWSIHYQERQKKIAACSVWKRGMTHGVQIIFPANTSWGWMKDVSPDDLIITLHYLEEALGVPIGSSPGRVGWNYLKHLYPEWTESIEGVDWKVMHFTPAAATDIIWKRPMQDFAIDSKLAEMTPTYLHKFDKAAAYPYAASQTDIGVGTPMYLEGEEAARAAVHEKGHPQGVGVWRCFVKYDLSKVNNGMPPVLRENMGASIRDEEWLAGPVIRLLRSMGHEVNVLEGWVFPERHNVLKKWAELLWDNRLNFNGGCSWKNERCAALAAKAVKTVMNTTIGMTAFKRFEEGDEMRRPDIRIQVIARHRELMRQNIEKFWVLYGASPLLVYMDAIYYLSDNPNGRLAFPAIVKREGQFGGYRWEGCITVTPEVVELFHVLKHEAAILETLNAMGWKRAGE